MTDVPSMLTLELSTGTNLAATSDGPARGLVCQALPYGEELRDRIDPVTGARRWVFEPGCARWRDNAALFYGHDHLGLGRPIGRVTTTHDTDSGAQASAMISATAKGDEVYTLLCDQVLDGVSVGFFPVSTRLEEADSGDPLLVFEEIDIWELSVVPVPAFASATIDHVLSKGNAMPSNPSPTALPAVEELGQRMDTLAAQQETLDRRLATLAGGGAADDTVTTGASSYGQFLQQLAQGDPTAVSALERIALAYAGGVTGDLGGVLRDAWIGDITRWVDAPRRVINAFTRRPLPADGMNIEYGRLSADTTQVDEQLAEGDVLAYGKIAFSTATTPVKTYGGWGEMTRQEIERSPINVIETFFRALLLRYAKRTEAVVRTLAGTNTASTPVPGVTNLADADGWIDFVTDAAFMLDDQGLTPEVLLVGRTAWKALTHLRDGAANDAPRLLDRTTGTLNITGLTGSLFTIPVFPVAFADATTVRLGHSSAIVSYEASGAPWRLQDDDITNLTKAMSIYGYMAVASENPAGLIRPGV